MTYLSACLVMFVAPAFPTFLERVILAQCPLAFDQYAATELQRRSVIMPFLYILTLLVYW